jgi:hypothetical protein
VTRELASGRSITPKYDPGASGAESVPLPGIEPDRRPVAAALIPHCPALKPPDNRSRPLGNHISTVAQLWRTCSANLCGCRCADAAPPRAILESRSVRAPQQRAARHVGIAQSRGSGGRKSAGPELSQTWVLPPSAESGNGSSARDAPVASGWRSLVTNWAVSAPRHVGGERPAHAPN